MGKPIQAVLFSGFEHPQQVAAALQVFIDLADGGGIERETLAACDQYTLQGEAFSRVVRGEIALPYGLDDAVMNMRIIDALLRSERSARWEAP